MSLLMDALRRAESSEDKEREGIPAAGTDTPADADKQELKLEPAVDSPATPAAAPATLTHSEIDEMLELESGNHDSSPVCEASPDPAAKSAENPQLMPLAEPDDEDTEGPASSPQSASSRGYYKSTAWFLSGLASVVVIVGGYYLWHIRQPGENTLITASADFSIPAYDGLLKETPAKGQVKPAEPQAANNEPVAKIAAPAPAVKRKTPPPANHGEANRTVAKKVPTQQDIKIHKTKRTDSIQTVLQQAYVNYKGKKYSQADKLYRQVLKRYPHNRDALLGLAAISMMRGDYVTARRSYERILKSNPSDTNARLGLQSILGSEDPIARISQLKILIDKHPRNAQLHFSVANQYAQLGQWTEAQQSYFEAVRLAPEQGDYSYNLAISLDQLGLGAQALEYYRKSQRLTANDTSLLDRQQLDTRIRQLQATSGDNP